MSLNDDWREFLHALITRRVRFVVIGAHALAVLGRVRYTQDLDVFVEPSPKNARRVVAALDDFGFGGLDVTAADFSRRDHVVMLGRLPFRIDILTSISGVSFAAAWKGATRSNVEGLALRFLGRREYARNKRAAGRPKDLADLALLAEVHPRRGR